jgi:hypothetical protein
MAENQKSAIHKKLAMEVAKKNPPPQSAMANI